MFVMLEVKTSLWPPVSQHRVTPNAKASINQFTNIFSRRIRLSANDKTLKETAIFEKVQAPVLKEETIAA